MAESHPPKRTRLGEEERRALGAVLEGSPEQALAGCLDLAGWQGAGSGALPVRTGLTPAEVRGALDALEGAECIVAGGRAFGAAVRDEARRRILAAVDRAHADDPLLTVIPLAAARSALPSWAPAELADAVIELVTEEGALELADGGVRRPGHRARLTREQEDVTHELLRTFAEGGLGPPLLDEFPESLRERRDFWPLVRRLEQEGMVRQVSDGLFIVTPELAAAEERIRSALKGRSGLGPADFREVLPVTRKHLIPLLNYFDGRGVTLRTGDGREVPADR